MSRISAKTTFEAARILRPIYTGGSTSLDASGRVLVTCVGEDALVIDLTTGNQLASLEGDGELITSLAITPSASHAVVCSRSMSMRIYSLTPLSSNNKKILEPSLLRTVKAHTSPVVTTAVDPTGTLLATGGADGSIKVWDIRGGFITHTFHGHGGVVTALTFFESLDDVVESKGAKGGRKRHNEIETEKLRTIRLASGDEEGKIRIWDLYKKKSIASLELHVSVVRNLSFAPEQNALLSASRDKTLIVWDVRTWKSRRIIPCLESLESAGCISDSALCFTGGERGVLRVWDMNRGGEITQQQEAGSETDAIITTHYSPNLPFVVTVHADQTIRIHSLESFAEYSPGSSLAPLPVIRRISGNDDEVIDLAYVGPERSMLAMATNTESIRIVSITAPGNGALSSETSDSYFGADVTYLDGHDDIIICVDVDWSGYWLATGAKDNSARLWRLDPETSSYTCAAILTGHAESLGAIALPRTPPPVGSKVYTDPLNHPPAFLFTGSQDRTIKKWDTNRIGTSQPVRASYTRKAHEKDINSLDVNHNATLLASASQDRTVKIWSAEDGSVVGILRGHKRGVWSVRFSPRDMPIITSTAGASTTRGLVATGSGDKTVKIWNLADFSCLLTFEGHTNSVLKVIWLPPSQFPSEDENGDESTNQDCTASRPLLASSAADGLVKIWSPYSGELETTLDNHTDRVWALASPTPSGSRSDVKVPSTSPYTLISGAADSTVTFWKDTTSATLTAAVSANSARIEQDQQLQNYIRTGAYREAITLALQLNHPARLLSLFTAAIEESDGNRSGEAKVKNDADEMALSGNSSVDAVLQSLDKDNLYLLLLRLRDWNTNARTAKVAQRILYTLVRSYPASVFIELANRPPPATASQGKRSQKNNSGLSLKEVFSALTSYTDRHYRRVEELVDESYLVEWVLDEMEGGMALVSGLSQKETKDAPPNREEDVLMLEV